MAEKYTKTLTMTVGGNTRTFTGDQANEIGRRLDNDPAYIKYTNNDGNVEYIYKMAGSCGFCVAATISTAAETVADTACEDSLAANCDNIGVSIDKSTASVAVGGTVTLVATTTPPYATPSVTWASSDATKAAVADGVVTGVAAGSATITATLTLGTKTYTDTATVTVTGE